MWRMIFPSKVLWKNRKTRPAFPGDPERSLASMGIYLFKKEVLLDVLESVEGMDFGHDIIPNLFGKYKVMAYPYKRNNRLSDYELVSLEDGRRERRFIEPTKDSGYWRDVGTLDAYWNANMDLCGLDPYFNLYGKLWPIHTHQKQLPPAKFVFADERKEPAPGRQGPGFSGEHRAASSPESCATRCWALRWSPSPGPRWMSA
jgi:ADP-glucose pyrophosphorylase